VNVHDLCFVHAYTVAEICTLSTDKGDSKDKVVLVLFLTEHHAMKAYWGVDSRERAPWYLLDRRLGGPQSCSGRAGEE
jgi:hypothetical protein